MPWRGIRDPYRIWVSEVMLQQTQVATAIPFYQRFLERFPTLAALSRGRLDDVLTSWAGLGYYQRARRLHEASRVLMREHGGRVPDDPAAFAALPGVGRYTVGAVMSIAFDRPLPVVDGNVARVLSRWFTMQDSIREPAGARRLWERAESLVPRRGSGDWNQAVMELGAVICTPRAPRCGACPVRSHCRAHTTGQTDAFPPSPVRRATERVRRAIVVACRGGRVLMRRREGRLLDGLWEPPGIEIVAGQAAARALRAELSTLGVRARLEPTGLEIRHRITHREMSVEVWRAEIEGPIGRRADVRFVDPRSPEVAITALARRAGKHVRPRKSAGKRSGSRR